jgi:nucleoside 2-deoxyribosyltransferase
MVTNNMEWGFIEMARLKAFVANPLIFHPGTTEWYKNVLNPVIEKYADVVMQPTTPTKLTDDMTNEQKSKVIFDGNVDRLRHSDFLIVVIDGVQTDDGTAWELGAAWAMGKPAIAVRFDARSGCHEQFSRYTNLMIENSCFDMVVGLEDLDKALAKFTASTNK